ncbi:MAG: shikimate dehydrogenase [Amaricoccus sp.]|uniref:shikimate dehydrogenase n=1 Tax=Amaricoccus sp. TaxID=1872485 RepID=UPI0039E4E2B9
MTDEPRLAAVTGWPVAHSRSPLVHGHWLRRYGIRGYYVPIALSPDAFAEGFLALPKLGFRGTNVTIPYKEMALALATDVSDAARAIGAANTITFGTDGSIHADNTDGYGFLANLRDAAPAWDAGSGPALVLGAGGASRAIVHALRSAGAPEVWIANRTAARAEAVAGHFGSGVRVLDWAEAEAAASAAATIVNTTSLGMKPGEPMPVALERLSPAALVTDVVYGAEPTAFVAAARRRGLMAVDGLGMLLHQAVPGFERWFGVRPQVDAELRAAALA